MRAATPIAEKEKRVFRRRALLRPPVMRQPSNATSMMTQQRVMERPIWPNCTGLTLNQLKNSLRFQA